MALYLDHVPVAVRSLDGAVHTYGERLGFRIKPGRPHPNGIRNAFAKFRDGSYLELISAGEATDDLSLWYRSFLARQEGGAFLSLRADSLAALARAFQGHGYEGSLQHHGRAFSILSFPGSVLHPVFLIQYPEPVRDQASVLDHPNTAIGLEGVWLPRRTFQTLAELPAVFPTAPDSTIALAGGVISMSRYPSRANVAGVTIRVRSIAAAEQALRKGMGESFPIRRDARGRSVVVPPAVTHGIWIEFLEPGIAP